MNVPKQAKVKAAREKPRFLFRVASSDHRSRGLNTPSEIDPLHGYGGSYHDCVTSLEWAQAKTMVEHHLRWWYKTASEFSSWSVSLLWVLWHAVRKSEFERQMDVRIYVLDTSELAGSRVYSSRKLVEQFALKHIEDLWENSEHEYLIHGRLEMSDGFESAPFAWLKAVGLDEMLPMLFYRKYKQLLPDRVKHLRWGSFGRFPGAMKAYRARLHPITSDTVSQYRPLGICFGEAWEATMTVAFLCLLRRDADTAAVDELLDTFDNLPLTPKLEFRDIVEGAFLGGGLKETKQFEDLMRLLQGRRNALDGDVQASHWTFDRLMAKLHTKWIAGLTKPLILVGHRHRPQQNGIPTPESSSGKSTMSILKRYQPSDDSDKENESPGVLAGRKRKRRHPLDATSWFDDDDEDKVSSDQLWGSEGSRC